MEKPENWSELTWQEKREKRFAWWRAAHGINFVSKEARAKHDARIDRTIKAIKIEIPDRVPVNIAAGSFPAYYAGYDLKTIMYDVEKMRQAWMKFAGDFDTDSLGWMTPSNGLVNDIMGNKVYKWPGGGLPDDASMIQFVETDYMKTNEYDAFLDNPTDYILRYFLPRTYRVFEPLARLSPLSSFMGVGNQIMMSAGDPDFRKMARSLLKAYKETVRWGKVIAECNKICREMGFPAGGEGIALAPFDTVADMLRGTRGSVMDIYHQPDKLLETCDKILDITLKSALEGADRGDSPMVFIPMHKGDDMFMSDKQFERFYWPSYKELLIGLIDEGLVPSPVVDGTYNRRLEYLKDLPRASMVWIFEKTDMALAKKVLGGHACIGGNVTGSLMCKGTPEDVEKYCCWLIDTCAPGGGYILSMGVSVDKANPENFQAMIKVAKEYGVYKK
jgi:uroporphyrinogen-III decarboxylase